MKGYTEKQVNKMRRLLVEYDYEVVDDGRMIEDFLNGYESYDDFHDNEIIERCIEYWGEDGLEEKLKLWGG